MKKEEIETMLRAALDVFLREPTAENRRRFEPLTETYQTLWIQERAAAAAPLPVRN